MSAERTRFDALDGLRGVAAIGVMVMHFTEASEHWIFKNGGMAVDFFFMLSAFVLAHSYKKRLLQGMTLAEFMARRMIRLYPMFLAAMIIGIPLFFAQIPEGLSDFSPREAVAASVYNAAMLPYFTGHHVTMLPPRPPHPYIFAGPGMIFPINPPAWSLFFEMLASVALVQLVRLRRDALMALIAVSAVALLACTYLAVADIGVVGHIASQGPVVPTFNGGLARVLFGFSTGLLIYALWSCTPQPSARKVIPGMTLVLYAALFAVMVVPWATSAWSGFATFVAAPLLLVLGSRLTTLTPLEGQLARWLGWLSYPVYCLHYPVGLLIYLYGAPALRLPYRSMALVALESGVSIVVAALVCRAYEEPVRAFLTRRLGARSVPVRALAGEG
jgi:peptidoglycan/LPS O-acetylase OafA/YrhL